jgi:hypothetical protein
VSRERPANVGEAVEDAPQALLALFIIVFRERVRGEGVGGCLPKTTDFAQRLDNDFAKGSRIIPNDFLKEPFL